MSEADGSAGTRLAAALRRIVARLAVVRAPEEELDRATEAASAFADRLDTLPERSRSWEVSEASLSPRDFISFSPVSGLRNPIAPPLAMRFEADRVVGEVTFGAQYEGPPGHVHGGWIAATFDELLGFAQREPGFTASLHVNYRRPTPLHTPLSLVAWTARIDGRKRYVRGECRSGATLLSDAEGLFIGPRPDQDYLTMLGLG